MSIKFRGKHTTPGLEAKSWTDGAIILSTDSGRITLGMDDYLTLSMYVLKNTDLEKNDPRLKFLKEVAKLEKLRGWNALVNPKAKTKRLGFPQAPPARSRRRTAA